ncbi:MAG: hypothetical protein H7A37_08905 [Chlamydiales bacterium]|nr:hypothetical protein [Chlamydiales bacterium]
MSHLENVSVDDSESVDQTVTPEVEVTNSSEENSEINEGAEKSSIENQEEQQTVPSENVNIDDSGSVNQAATPEVKEGRANKGKQQSDPELEAFLVEMDKKSTPEEKLQNAIDYMQETLSQSGTPQFRHFWEVRKRCLDLFKENMPAPIRSVLWEKYSELSKEARRLKEILDEQSAFAVEQIDIAIKALEGEIVDFDNQLAKIGNVDFGFESKYLEKALGGYNTIQKQLCLLNAFASRVNTLRKELIKTEMRIRQKNKFFQRLSKAGDQVFPRRKDLIKEVSEKFEKDVTHFIKKYFSDNSVNEPLHFLREEIKSLQGIAKVLTLNTTAFTTTRSRLSECWDQLKELDKEKKKERAAKFDEYKANAVEIEKLIEAFVEEQNQSELSAPAAFDKLDDILREMRQVQLGRTEVKALKDKIAELRAPIQAKINAMEAERQRTIKEKIEQKKARVSQLQSDIEQLKEGANQITLEELESKSEQAQTEMNDLGLSRAEKQEFQRHFRQLNDILNSKKEEALLTLSDDDKENLTNLRSVLSQRKERRKEVKEQLDEYRKLAGSSGLDFEKAMEYNELLNAEKERLENIDAGISDIEKKISALKKKTS